ncbi:MAG TPA: fibronectin type III domain-containing protein [Phycisphaerae bacterium]|nr:fibronectin type III domain-containing protein [Phycisphaerae bacterium]HRR86974.1 fibronectin type III domain-containing protein [Phycisphaerae bacterium]
MTAVIGLASSAGLCFGEVSPSYVLADADGNALGAAEAGIEDIENRLAVAVERAGAPDPQSGESLLPAGTGLDRFEWVDDRAHVDLTFPAETAPDTIGPLRLEDIYEVLANAVDPFRMSRGLVIRARRGPTAEYLPLEAYTPTVVLPPEQDVREESGIVIEERSRAFAEASTGEQVVEAWIGGPVEHAGTQPVGALTGVTVFCSAGHGWTAGSSSWYLQRSLLLDMVEDYGNIDQLNYFVQYLYNAGATVVPFRPVGYQAVEVVLDNDDPGVTYSGTWTNSTATTEYYENGTTVSGVPYRWATAAVTESATARYTPNIPATDFYPVYCWTRDGTDRVRQTYRIAHSGGVSSVTVDHRLVGKGWIWLGDYYMLAGASSYVEITNASPDTGVVIADAIRFGNGMGDIVRPGPGTISGYPREEECSRYWAQSEAGNNAVGLPQVWETSGDDGSDNVGTAARWSAVMNRQNVNNDRWRRIYIEFHTNAAGCSPPPCSAKGTICLVTNTGATTYQTEYATILGDKVEADMRLIDDDLFEYLWGLRSNPYTSAYGAISTSNNNDEFDATIIEVAFHDNVEDTANLLNAKVRNAVARSTLQGMIMFLNSLPGSTVPLVFLPDPPENVRAVHNGQGSIVVSWNAPPSGGANGGAAAGYRVYRSSNGYGFGQGLDVGNVLTTTLTDVPAGTTTYLRVTAYNAGGESLPSRTMAVRREPDASTQLLIVDGYNRVSRHQNVVQVIPAGPMQRPIARKVNSFDYVVQHATAMSDSGVAFDYAENSAVAGGAVSLNNYRAVIWILGQESTADKTFDSNEQMIVTAYLNAGGNLFVTGSDIGYELDGQAAGRPFYENMLRANYEADNAGTYSVLGAGGIMADVGPFDFNPNNGAAYVVKTPDRISPQSGAAAILSYGGGNGTAGIQYDSGVYRVVMFGFPFEAISTSSARSAVMQRVLNYILPPMGCPYGPDAITGFEGYADGTHVMFQDPRYSGSTLAHLAATPNSAVVTSEVQAYSGGKTCRVDWAWLDASPTRWLRLTTHNVANVPNPTIDLRRPVRVRLRLDSGSFRISLGVRETGADVPIGENGGTSGTIEWVGATSVVPGGGPVGTLVSAAPGVWQTITFAPYVGYIQPMTGDGVLNAAHDKGVLEHLAFTITDTVGPITVYLDSIEQPCPPKADFDLDGDVDLIDFGLLQACISGASKPQTAAECQVAKLDGDGDVDQDDCSLFLMCLSGPGVPAVPECLN